MMAVPANDLGIDFKVFTSNENDSAAQVSKYVIGDYNNAADVLAFAKQCDVVTFEHELVPQRVIRAIEQAGIRVYPKASSFSYSQDKLVMREKIAEMGLPNPKWSRYDGGAIEIPFPLIAKVPTGGYDGRGVWVINSADQLAELHKEAGLLLLEEKIDFDFEIDDTSVVSFIEAKKPGKLSTVKRGQALGTIIQK